MSDSKKGKFERLAESGIPVTVVTPDVSGNFDIPGAIFGPEEGTENIHHVSNALALIEKRMSLNVWTPEKMAQYIRYHIDGEGEDDGVNREVAETNKKLRQAFRPLADTISTDGIQKHLDKVVANDPDWLPHLDIALAMALANPQAVTEKQIEAIKAIADEPKTVQTVSSNVTKIRPEYASRFLKEIAFKP